MLLSCPNCQTQYDVPDAALTGRRRTLRCANCMTKWQVPALAMYRDPEPAAAEPAPEPAAPELVQEPATPAPAVEPDPVPAAETRSELIAEDTVFIETAEITATPEARVSPLSASRSPQAEAPAPSRTGLKLSVLLVLIILLAILAAHRPIGQLWPPSLRLFNALGLH